MKKRSGVDEGEAFGPAPGSGTLWALTTKNGVTLTSWGSTAFQAAANVGLNLGQLSKVQVMT